MRYLFMLLMLSCCDTLHAQERDTLIRKLDSLGRVTDSADGQRNDIRREAYSPATRLTFKSYFILLGSNVKQAFTKPFHMKGRDWGIAGQFTLAAVALSFADKPLQRTALRWRHNSSTLRDVSAYVTEVGGDYEGIVLGGIGLYGYVFKNRKMRTTTWLATQSYLTGSLLFGTIKLIAGRQRPYVVDPETLESNPTFHGPFYRPPGGGLTGNRSFPSGHTTVAFAAATVYALEYRNRPWVPILAYSTASLIGLSRVTENKHWVTDVLAGAGLGYLCGRLVVNNYHRYAELKEPGTRKATVSLSLQYHFGQLMPGVLYTFR
jgi:membrane-associated phospholipid phosphatase